MFNKILVRYGEMALKGRNRFAFVNKLKQNMEQHHRLEPQVSYERVFLPYTEGNMKKLPFVIGIASFSPVISVAPNYEAVARAVLLLATNKTGTFQVRTYRHFKKHFTSSQSLNKSLGALVTQKSSLRVNLSTPDYTFYVAVLKNQVCLFTRKHPGLGGLPVGVNGKALLLLSGGIDSPVAGFKMMQRGLHVDFVSFVTPKHKADAAAFEVKIVKIIKTLGRYQGSATWYKVHHTTCAQMLGLITCPSYRTVLLRRSFMRIAAKIAEQNHHPALITGESLGQVASQTLPAIKVIQASTTTPVLRPLVGQDKRLVIHQAEQIQTYKLSLLKVSEACETNAPFNPVINPTVKKAERIESEELPDLAETEATALKNEKHQIVFPD